MSGSPVEPHEVAADRDAIDVARPQFEHTLAERWATLRREPRLAAGGLALVALAAGAWWVRLSVTGPSGAAGTSAAASTTIERFSSSPPRVTTSTAPVVIVDVVGAVRRAGVVSLPGSARVIDALTAAGGALPNADLERINLAAHLVDGMRIAVPRRGAPADVAAPAGDSGAPAGARAERRHPTHRSPSTRRRKRSSKRCPASVLRSRRRSSPNATAKVGSTRSRICDESVASATCASRNSASW